MTSPNVSDILKRYASFCSSSEHCINDIKNRLNRTSLNEKEKEYILDYLVHEDFINEKRFCLAFVTDKLRFNKWGKKRIAFELMKRKIDRQLIEESLSSVDETFYKNILSDLLKKRIDKIVAKNEQELLYKLTAFASGKGFESDLVSKIARRLIDHQTKNEKMD